LKQARLRETRRVRRKTERRLVMKTALFRNSLLAMLAASTLHAQSLNWFDSAGSSAVRYTVTDLGTLGGTFSVAYGINNAGRVGGAASLPSGNVHAFLSGAGGTRYDLGTLGGPNSQGNRPDGMINLSVVSETSTPDPLQEDFCGFGNHLVCLGALWNGVMTPLPTLGGNNAMAVISNNHGQIAGVAENGTRDAACPAPQVLDFEAAVWGPGKGEVHGLAPLPGDTVGFALGINESGQAVGSSGTCANTVVTAVGLFTGQHAVLWNNGAATSLGTLGGTMGKAGAINDRGEVAGFSSLPGDASVHAFLWTRQSGMQDLGALGADYLGDPAGINNSTQIVGGSCEANGNCRAFLWEKNVLSDLNDLIAPDSPLYLIYALGINDAGEIVGFAMQKNTGDLHAYLAHPVRGNSGSPGAAPTVTTESRPIALPENIRVLFQQRLPFGRAGARAVGRP
jgi:probable HAF family extracellular repeat protein